LDTLLLVESLQDQLDDARAEIATLRTVLRQKDDEIARLQCDSHYSKMATMTL